jgi:nucleotidyltransferase/DNA polymerase involved in DNA repair
MSVLCCHVPDFLWSLAQRHQPELSEHPIALVGPDDLIWATAPLAHKLGVMPQMTLRQAQSHCSDLRLLPVDLVESQAAQHSFLSTLATWELPLEENSWGHAYIDLHTVATTRSQVQPLAIELGQLVRKTLGIELQPAVGWDSGKFTARAAAAIVQPGRVRLVSREDETRFLRPLPVSLLPLSPVAHQELQWLGIHTLGQFAQLPVHAVVQRFGTAGRVAHQWAQGHDTRPVRNTVRANFSPLSVQLDPPTGLLEPVLEALLGVLRPHLNALAVELAGCRKINVELGFLDGSTRTLVMSLVTAISQEATLQATLAHHLQTLNWPAEVAKLTIVGLEIGELPAEQLSLFPEFTDNTSPGALLVQRLSGVYGDVFFRGDVVEPCHPIAERRSVMATWV